MSTRDEVLATVTDLGATSSRPALDTATVERIVDRHRVVDGNRRPPSDADWTPTYDTNGAVAEVYRIKAGRVAGDFTFSADGASFSKGDVLAHLLSMEAQYAAKSTSGSSTLVTGVVGPTSLDQLADKLVP